MPDHGLQARFAKSCTEAAFGYARAANAAYVAAAEQTLEFWGKAAREAARSAERTSADGGRSSTDDAWQEPARDFWRKAAAPSTNPPLNPWAMNPWTANPWTANPWSAMGSMPQQMVMQQMAAWWGMFPLRGAPASWPGAYALMTAGVPKEVAWPTAEANVAMLDAAQAATEQVEQVTWTFASYRTETGYATSQMRVTQIAIAALMVAPLMAMAAMPTAGSYGAGF